MQRLVDPVYRDGIEQKNRRDAAVLLGEQIHFDGPTGQHREHFFQPCCGQARMRLGRQSLEGLPSVNVMRADLNAIRLAQLCRVEFEQGRAQFKRLHRASFLD
ncbi:hypothetical protein D3C85_1170210 [compost metagenome]